MAYKSSAFIYALLHIVNNLHFVSKYSFISACSFSLICSSDKFVKIPILKSEPYTLFNFKLCEDTSITTTSHFAAAILANNSCNSKLSGVVLSLSPKSSAPI